MRILALGLALAMASPVAGQDFWAHWGDGQAEVNGYQLTQPRYGAHAPGTAVLIFVTEDFADSPRVKADAGRHPESEVYPVLKLNVVREFQTGVYEYNVMTSVFARVEAGWPLAKISFSSQEWCGQVYRQLIPREGRVASVLHSYFDGEADAALELPSREGGVYEDALPILLRGWQGGYLRPGETRSVALMPSLLRARLEHVSPAWRDATISLQADTDTVRVPAGEFEVATWVVEHDAGPRMTYQIEAASPYRLVRWSADDGEVGELLGSERMAYWRLNGPGNESRLTDIGLAPPAHSGP